MPEPTIFLLAVLIVAAAALGMVCLTRVKAPSAPRWRPEDEVEDGCHYYVNDGDQEAAVAYRRDGIWYALPGGEALGWIPLAVFGPIPARPDEGAS